MLSSLFIYQRLSTTKVRLVSSRQIKKKDFDTVDHDYLITVLKSLGFETPLLHSLYFYIFRKKQFVKIKNVISDLSEIPSVIPQGDHRSSFLLIILVNSVTEWITKAKFLLFAGNTNIFLKMYDLNQCNTPQSKFNIFINWINRISLKLNTNKSLHVIF